MIKAEKIIHDREKQNIEYTNAVLNIFDIPVLYFPKFFHPDPTVKRRSGFLTPSFSAGSDSYFKIPYFLKFQIILTLHFLQDFMRMKKLFFRVNID